MNFEIYAACEPSVALMRAGSDPRALSFLDGTGCWGDGIAASHVTHERLQARLEESFPASGDGFAEVMSGTGKEVVQEFLDRTSERPSVGAMAILMRAGSVQVIAAGPYEVAHFSFGRRKAVVRPTMWIDDSVRSGGLTAQAAETHPLRHIYGGPLLGDGAVVHPPWTVVPGDAILLMSVWVAKELEVSEMVRLLANRTTAAENIRALGMERLRQRHSVVIIDVTADSLFAAPPPPR